MEAFKAPNKAVSIFLLASPFWTTAYGGGYRVVDVVDVSPCLEALYWLPG
jgi:hypothetical protein